MTVNENRAKYFVSESIFILEDGTKLIQGYVIIYNPDRNTYKRDVNEIFDLREYAQARCNSFNEGLYTPMLTKWKTLNVKQDEYKTILDSFGLEGCPLKINTTTSQPEYIYSE